MDDVKTPLLPQPQHAPHGLTAADQQLHPEASMARRSRRARFPIAAVVLLVSLFWLARTWSCDHEHGEKETRVPLEVHIMSKCPDARDCVKKLVLPAMAEVADKVDFTLSFIGTVTDEDDGVQCKHGQTECLGNILMLCAAAEYPDPKLHLGFAHCLLSDYAEIPSQTLAEDCALEHGLDFARLNDCMSRDSGGFGMGLLRRSVLRSRDAGVETSCTVRLDGKVRCVYDDGEWRDCGNGESPGELVRDIERLYDEARGWTY